MLIQFSQADQRLCEWRCAFGSAALMIVNTFFLAFDFNTDEERQALSAEQLEGYTFLYGEVGVKKNREVGNNIVAEFYHSFLLVNTQRNFLWTPCPPDIRSPSNCYYWCCQRTKHW